MAYLIAHTIKTICADARFRDYDLFTDHYTIYDSRKEAVKAYDSIISKELPEGQEVYTAHLCRIVNSTDGLEVEFYNDQLQLDLLKIIKHYEDQPQDLQDKMPFMEAGYNDENKMQEYYINLEAVTGIKYFYNRRSKMDRDFKLLQAMLTKLNVK